MRERSLVLMVEPDDHDREISSSSLWGFVDEIEQVSTGAEALTTLECRRFDLVLIDAALPDMTCLELRRQILERYAGTAVLILAESATGIRDGDAPCQALADCIVKREGYAQTLRSAVRKILGVADAPRLGDRRRDACALASRIVGKTAEIQTVRDLIEDYAPTDAPVLITGETGTGKELVALELHERSMRSGSPIVCVNCAAIPEELLESELFGSIRGAYTGSHRDHPGMIAEAKGGTLFLDEIGEMPMRAQAKMLRVLEYGTYRRLGGRSDERAEFRLIAATNRSLRQMVAESRCRADLYYRLHVLQIAVPPLRERRRDIEELVAHFIERELPCGARPQIAPGAIDQLMTARWPGNVRELAHSVRRTLIRWKGGPILRFDLGDGRDDGATSAQRRGEEARRALADVLLRQAGQLQAVAQDLGISVRTVQRRMKDHGLALRDFRPSKRG